MQHRSALALQPCHLRNPLPHLCGAVLRRHHTSGCLATRLCLDGTASRRRLLAAVFSLRDKSCFKKGAKAPGDVGLRKKRAPCHNRQTRAPGMDVSNSMVLEGATGNNPMNKCWGQPISLPSSTPSGHTWVPVELIAQKGVVSLLGAFLSGE